MTTDTIVLSTIGSDTVEAVEFNWADSTMTTGVIAQEITSIDLTSSTWATGAVGSTITISSIDDLYSSPTKSEHNELVDRIAKLEKLIAEEAEIRANNPAVKTAYDEYRLLLVLAKQHTDSPLTEE